MRVFHGTLVHSPDTGRLDILSNRALGVKDGKIVFNECGEKIKEIKDIYHFEDCDVTVLKTGEFLLPGFVDSHIHASQYTNAGKALDLTLLKWLDQYTFPTEATFKDPNVGYQIYKRVVKKVLQSGTTTACYFATIHLQSTLKLCDVVEEYGQRAYVGKVNMNQNSPDNYIEDTKSSVENTERFIQNVKERKNDLLDAVITPRFAISATEELMNQLGELVKKYDVPVQSHVSETEAECDLVKKLFPKHKDYVDVYHKCGLLSNKTVLAHGIYLNDDELEVLQNTGTGISHCPNSNTSLKSGHCDVRKLQKHNVKVGLGTDVSGGYSPSMMDAMRQAVAVSNTIAIKEAANKRTYNALNYRDVLSLATLGGAKVLGLEDRIGNFEVGKEFDALHIKLLSPESRIDIWPTDTIADMVEKFVFLGDDRNIGAVYVKGKQIDLSS